MAKGHGKKNPLAVLNIALFIICLILFVIIVTAEIMIRKIKKSERRDENDEKTE